MLEILFLRFLCKAIATKVRDKGRSAGGYIALTILLWFGGEITGAIIGFSGHADGATPYLFALMGAATGATIAWAIASAVKPLNQMDPLVGRIFE